MKPYYVLAIETSCDDSAVAILNTSGEVCAELISSQTVAHAPYGGVVPEIASRQHLSHIASLVQEALDKAKLQPTDVQAVAVTFAPGLIGSLLVGVHFAKGFAQGLSIPIIGIHHMEGHLMAGSGEDDFPKPPFITLIVSGGHSALYLCDGNFRFTTLGETRDDAAGEAFDKIGKILGLGYPAGPRIDALAQTGDAHRFTLPVALKANATLDYSFSGLKTAARLLIEEQRKETGEIDAQTLSDICACLQTVIVEALLSKAILACQRHQINHLVLGGGVSANTLLRSEAKKRGEANGIVVHLPPKAHCMDNAVMIARAALRRLKLQEQSSLDLDAKATLSVDFKTYDAKAE